MNIHENTTELAMALQQWEKFSTAFRLKLQIQQTWTPLCLCASFSQAFFPDTKTKIPPWKVELLISAFAKLNYVFSKQLLILTFPSVLDM